MRKSYNSATTVEVLRFEPQVNLFVENDFQRAQALLDSNMGWEEVPTGRCMDISPKGGTYVEKGLFLKTIDQGDIQDTVGRIEMRLRKPKSVLGSKNVDQANPMSEILDIGVQGVVLDKLVRYVPANGNGLPALDEGVEIDWEQELFRYKIQSTPLEYAERFKTNWPPKR